MVASLSTLESKSEFEHVLDNLAERDFENALKLCTETIDKVSLAFENYLSEIKACEQRLQEHLDGSSENKVFVTVGELEKDLAAIPKQRTYVQDWQSRYADLSDKFRSFIHFLKDYHLEQQGSQQTDFWKDKVKVFREFQDLNTFYSEYEEVMKKIQGDLFTSMMFNYKLNGIPLNENNYTQATADLYVRFLAVRVIVNLHFDMCCLHDLTARVFSWVNKPQPASR